MTLSEIATLACTKLHRTDAESVAEMKVYIRARYKMIWDSRPWKDTLALMTISATSDQTVILPIIASRVLAVRWSNSVLDADQLITVFVQDPTRFDETTNPISYSLIAPSGVESIPGGSALQLFSDASDASFSVSIHGLLGNVDTREVVSIAGASAHNSVNSYDEILSLAKTTCENSLTVKRNDNAATILSLPAKESSRQYQRIFFHSTPLDSAETFIIYKRRCNDLRDDSDATEITGVDNGLLAMACSDMLEAQRQFSKAGSKAQEASTLIQQAVDQEVHQQANIIRITPEVYSAEYGDLCDNYLP